MIRQRLKPIRSNNVSKNSNNDGMVHVGDTNRIVNFENRKLHPHTGASCRGRNNKTKIIIIVVFFVIVVLTILVLSQTTRPWRLLTSFDHHNYNQNPGAYLYPIMIQYDYVSNSATTTVLSRLPINIEHIEEDGIVTASNLLNVIKEEENYFGSDTGKYDEQECHYVHDWQHKTSYPNCQQFHENINFQSILWMDDDKSLIGCGTARCAYYVSDESSSNDKAAVLKIVDYEDFNFDHRFIFKSNRRDAMVLERLTKSPYVLSTYGYCGDINLIEPGLPVRGSLYDLIKRSRKKIKRRRKLQMLSNKDYNQYINGDSIISSIDTLKVGIHITKAVADVHTFEDDGLVSVIHSDIDSQQFIYIDGMYKLNDFQLAQYQSRRQRKSRRTQPEQEEGTQQQQQQQQHKKRTLRQNKRDKEYEFCPLGVAHNQQFALVHAPEEVDRKKLTDRSKVDVYMMGNVLYFLLTKEWLYKVENNNTKIVQPKTLKDAVDLLSRGVTSSIPKYLKDYGDNDDPSIHALTQAIGMCWTFDSKLRPTAKEISSFLIQELQNILVREGRTGASGQQQQYPEQKLIIKNNTNGDYIVNTTLLKVSIPALPSKYKFTDTDYYTMFDY